MDKSQEEPFLHETAGRDRPVEPVEMSLVETAKYLGVCEAKVRNMVKDGTLKTRRTKRRHYVNIKEAQIARQTINDKRIKTQAAKILRNNQNKKDTHRYY